MRFKAKIALSIPNADKPDRYFSLQLKQMLQVEPSEYSGPGKLLVISDIEGNFQPFCQLLMANKVIDKYFEWIFEEGHLVILGDCFDKGEQVVECLWLIYMLEEKAQKHGGKVHYILGNHEIMNLNGDWRYVHPKYANHSKIINNQVALYDGNNEIWRWLKTKNIMERIGKTLFVHGGISNDVIQLDLSVFEINNIARPYYTRANELFANNTLSTIFNSEKSPFWYRGYYHNAVNEDFIDVVLKQYKVNTIVTGHTIMQKVSSYYNGKVINVNTDHAAGISEALLIKNGKFYRVDKMKNKEQIK